MVFWNMAYKSMKVNMVFFSDFNDFSSYISYILILSYVITFIIFLGTRYGLLTLVFTRPTWTSQVGTSPFTISFSKFEFTISFNKFYKKTLTHWPLETLYSWLEKVLSFLNIILKHTFMFRIISIASNNRLRAYFQTNFGFAAYIFCIFQDQFHVAVIKNTLFTSVFSRHIDD